MKGLYLLAIAILVIACNSNKKDEPVPEKKETVTIDTTLVTDSSWGPIRENTSFEELQQFYGVANVKDDSICGPECADTIAVTLIYPGTPKEIIVMWKDSFYHKTVGTLENRDFQSPYHVSSGLKSGSSMSALLKVNGQKIAFSGFGWDYGGYIQSYNKGTLDSSHVHFRLDLDDFNDNTIMGDVELNTDMPAVKKVLDKIRIWTISLSFYKS